MTQKNTTPIHVDDLIEAILHLETAEECRDFLEDICTIAEIAALAQRYRVARMLDEGNNYQEICRTTGASTTTICRVNKCLTYGNGYRTALDKRSKIDKKEENQ